MHTTINATTAVTGGEVTHVLNVLPTLTALDNEMIHLVGTIGTAPLGQQAQSGATVVAELNIACVF